jgi:hypothetical protein
MQERHIMSDEDIKETMRDGQEVEESIPGDSREGRIIPVGQVPPVPAAAMVDKETKTMGTLKPEATTNSSAAPDPSVVPKRGMEMPPVGADMSGEQERTTE